jgi:hypothetical protein
MHDYRSFISFLLQIKDNLIENAKKIGWKKIIEDHAKLFMMDENEIVEIAKR